MRNATYDELERIAGQAGWDGFTLLCWSAVGPSKRTFRAA